jgi:hypothetical protein
MLNDSQTKVRSLQTDKTRLEDDLARTDQKQQLLSYQTANSKLKKDLATKTIKQNQLDKAIKELNHRMI